MNIEKTRKRAGWMLMAALLIGGLTAVPAAADGFLQDSSIGLRLGYFEPINAADSYDAVYGSGAAIYGILWDWRPKDFLTIEGEYYHFSKSGERVNLVDGSWVGNGISEDLTYDSFVFSGKYIFMRDAGIRPFAGGGLGMYAIDVSSAVGGESFSKLGYHITAGALFIPEKKISVTAELRYTLIPSVLGDNPNSVSAYYGESDAGGLTLAFGVLYNFGR